MKGWISFPIWGLEMADNGFGLERPIFGDATIVSRGFIQKSVEPDAAAIMSGGGLREVLSSSPTTHHGLPPLEHLLEIAPQAFIAVRRENPEDAERYAQSIRALLTATYAHTTGDYKGFAMTPLPLHWAMVPCKIQLNKDGNLETHQKPVVSNYLHLIPVRVTHKQLRDSWNNGSHIGGLWKLHKEHPLSKALVGNWSTLSGLRKRIRSAATILARGMESVDPTLSTLFATAALETLLKDGNSDFDELEDLATCVFDGDSARVDIRRLFSNRHRIAHEAWSPDGGVEHTRELAATWSVLYAASIGADNVANVGEYLEYLRGRVRAHSVADQIRQLGKPELADEVESAVDCFPAKSGAKSAKH